MKHIKAENVDYVYFAPEDDISQMATLSESEPMWSNPFMREHWNAFPDLRLVAVVLPWSKSVLVYWLYWGDGTDLHALDLRVKAGTYTDADFEGSLKTVYSRHICFSCNREWDALIIPPGDPYLGAPGLDDRKLKAWWPRLLKCPACGASQRQLVVKIFGEHGRS